MREPKFKARILYDSGWVSGYFYRYAFQETGFILSGAARFFVDPETLCEVTEFVDKNQTPIAEHDIVKVDGGFKDVDGSPIPPGYDEVLLINGCWSLKHGDLWPCLLCEYKPEYLEIVGNSFDNPELLQDGDSSASLRMTGDAK